MTAEDFWRVYFAPYPDALCHHLLSRSQVCEFAHAYHKAALVAIAIANSPPSGLNEDQL